jgi:hypothetical protein
MEGKQTAAAWVSVVALASFFISSILKLERQRRQKLT